MVQNENQIAFQKRLAKIEARVNADETISAKFKRKQKGGSANGRRRGTMVMAVILLLGVAALPVLHQKFPDQFAMPSIAALLEKGDDAASEDS